MIAPATRLRQKSGRGTGLWEPSSGQRKLRDTIARAFGFEPLDAVTRGRGRGIDRMRFAQAWVLSRRYPQLSREAVGQLVARDHSTVIYSMRQADELRATDMAFHFLTTALLEGRELPPVERIPAKLTAKIPDRIVSALTPEERAAEREERVGEEHFGGIALGSFMLLEALRRDHHNLIAERMAA